MRVAARMVVMGMAIGVLGAADARGPNLVDSHKALAADPGGPDLNLLSKSTANDGHKLAATETVVASSSRSNDSSKSDLWLLGGVGAGLIAYQLRRKHRLLRPQPFQLRTDL